MPNIDEMKYFAATVDDTLSDLDVDSQSGLDEEQVDSRRDQYGTNELQHTKRRDALQILVEQFKSVVIIILTIAGIAALLSAQWVEAAAIAAVVVVNTAIGFFTEFKAARSMEEIGRAHV